MESDRFVFVDESAANLSMGRDYAWIQRGQELDDPRPMNWGRKSLTMIGALRARGWVALGTLWGAAKGETFARWVRERLCPKLQQGDIVVMDNAQVHRGSLVRELIEAVGAQLRFLPPYSPDLNPIESGWALVKRHIRKHAPRCEQALLRVARRARYVVKPHHCAGWVTHAGYSARPESD